MLILVHKMMTGTWSLGHRQASLDILGIVAMMDKQVCFEGRTDDEQVCI